MKTKKTWFDSKASRGDDAYKRENTGKKISIIPGIGSANLGRSLQGSQSYKGGKTIPSRKLKVMKAPEFKGKLKVKRYAK